MKLTNRARALIGVAVALIWAVQRAGVDQEVVNPGGWPSFRRFWVAVARPEIGLEFVELTARAAGTTIGFAVLGIIVSMILGIVGGLALSELLWEGRRGRWLARVTLVVPRAVHEVLWALLLIQFLGFDPMVAVLAIGIPYGAITAKVFAETIDEADPGPYRALRATGARRATALVYGTLPTVRADLVSYAFYRLECAIRSAAILGVIGAGGLGFQLDLSFQTLRYHEIWTLIAALMVLSGLADAWSSRVRRGNASPVDWIWLGALIPLSVWWTRTDPTTLWSSRTRRLAVEFLGDLLPPRLGPGGWSELAEAALDTAAMSILATTIAVTGALLVAVASSRPTDTIDRRDLPGRVVALVLRTSLLLLRAVPPPVWAFVFVLVLFPGTWPGAVALGVYNLGVVGRLYAEILEDADPRPARLLAAVGATSTQRFLYATLPAAAPRLVSIALYRWEVIMRETVVVGVVGAGGLGRLAREHLAARDFAAITSVIAALVVLALVVDTLSAGLRRSLRIETRRVAS